MNNKKSAKVVPPSSVNRPDGMPPSYSESSRKHRERWLRAERTALEAHQLSRLNRVLTEVVSKDGFYRRKYHADSLRLTSLESLSRLPMLTKSEIDTGDGTPAKFHTYMPDVYSRFHRTSGTHGQPLPVMDTLADWQWWIDTWQYVLDAGDVTSDDVAMMAFSFGPFIGFWSANDAIAARGAMVVPGGGISSSGRYGLIQQSGATVLCCTPTYAIHLAESAKSEGHDPRKSSIRLIIVAGEPGGSLPETRAKMENVWGARVLDHAGATEIGPWGVGSRDGTGLYVIESEFIAELIQPGGDQPVAEGELAELVLTGLGRLGAPAIRYRTGDLVRGYRDREPNCRFLWLDGGVLGRVDDMLVIRGVNVFPSSVERIIRSFPRFEEFQLIATRRGSMDELEIAVEDPLEQPSDLIAALEQRLSLRVSVRSVPLNSLPRFEAKAKRLLDRRFF